MMFRYLTLLTLTFSLSAMAAVGRKPAVEDFVGIEVDHPEATPQGTEGLFNFEKDMTHFEKSGTVKRYNKFSTQENLPSITWSMSKIFAIIMAVGFPALIWFVAINNLRKKAGMQNAANIEVLEKYRKERELAKKAENTKKVA
jgi:hypothetical protein